MAQVAEDVDQPHRRFRVAWIVFPFCVLAAVTSMFLFRFKSVAKTKTDYWKVLENHDWKTFADLLPPLNLQEGTLPKEKLVAFLDRYIPKSEKLDVFKTEYAGQTGIEATFNGDHINGHERLRTARITIFVVPDENQISVLPPNPRIKFDYSQVFTMVAHHEFPDTERFDPRHWSAAKSSHRPKNYAVSTFLFAIREKANLEAMGMPTYWGPSVAPGTWDRFISSLREGIKRDGWDVPALLKAYKLSDSEAPAKDSRRP